MSEVYRFEIFNQFPELIHGISTAKLGNMSYRWGKPEEVKQNRANFEQHLGVSADQIVGSQLVHGDKFHQVGLKERGLGMTDPETGLEGDGFFTAEPAVYLFLVVADCLGLFFYDPVKKVCGLIHAGWKGVELRVPQKAIKFMVDQFGCQTENIWVGMSPAIQAQSLHFPTKTVEQKQLSGWGTYLQESGEECWIDVNRYAYDQLVQNGIKPAQIDRSPIDTRTDPHFFSHRRSVEEKLPEARFACLIGRKS